MDMNLNDSDLQKLIGLYLYEIDIGPFSFTLQLRSSANAIDDKEEGYGIMVCDVFSCVANGVPYTGAADQPDSVLPLVKFLMDEICLVEQLQNGDLGIRFKNTGEVIIYKDPSGFDSFTVYLGNGDMYVG